MSQPLPNQLTELGPSAEIVYLILRSTERALTKEEIYEMTGQSTSSVSRACEKLVDNELAETASVYDTDEPVHFL